MKSSNIISLKPCPRCGKNTVVASYEEDQRYKYKCACGQYFEFNAQSQFAADMIYNNIKIKPINRKTCGGCAYAIPTTFGKSKGYVECTNRRHIETYCKYKSSVKRYKTTPACKSYKEAFTAL